MNATNRKNCDVSTKQQCHNPSLTTYLITAFIGGNISTTNSFQVLVANILVASNNSTIITWWGVVTMKLFLKNSCKTMCSANTEVYVVYYQIMYTRTSVLQTSWHSSTNASCHNDSGKLMITVNKNSSWKYFFRALNLQSFDPKL